MPTPTKEDLVERAQIVRTFEASCKIDHPTDDERNFRVALMKKLGTGWGLKSCARSRSSQRAGER
ncbi:MAG: hypothetical protein WCL04_03540 [Verrucomicrobiota bacterium]